MKHAADPLCHAVRAIDVTLEIDGVAIRPGAMIWCAIGTGTWPNAKDFLLPEVVAGTIEPVT
jgi:hypothetical protein